MKVDFCQEIDPVCQYNPRILACDGTHIGISIKHLHLEKPITHPDTDEIQKAKHQRVNRVLLRNKENRQQVRYLCNDVMGTHTQEEITHFPNPHQTNIDLHNFIEANCSPPVKNFIQTLLDHNQDEEVLKEMAYILHMVTGDAAISSVVPFPSHEPITQACISLKFHNILNEENLKDVRKFNKQIPRLLHLAQLNDCVDIVASFVLELIDMTVQVHQDDNIFAPPAAIPGTYNPPSGTAYYFSPTGKQLHSMPDLQVNKTSTKKNYDDNPLIDGHCNKRYPSVSYGRYGYMFIWFCPIHGHMYDFHLIDGAEGRKGPFCSLFKYKEEMPDHIFYDFACSLSEYCFWHDLFHSVGHICGDNFKSKSIHGLEGLNTEICEQVNSYLQCIKYTGAHLSQEKFMFFTQFFLYLLNKNKTKKFNMNANVAMAFQL